MDVDLGADAAQPRPAAVRPPADASPARHHLHLILSRLGRVALALAPALPTALVVAVVGWYYAQIDRYRGPIAFATIGVEFACRAGLQRLATSRWGYDGQFAYFIARDPSSLLACAHRTGPCPFDDPALRAERILYPLTARALALGRVDLVPDAMIAINVAALLAGAVVLGQLFAEMGRSRWLGVGAALYCGALLGLLRDLSDPYALMWLVLAVWLARRDRPLLAALAAAAALLAREQLVFILPFLALPLLARRRWLAAAGAAVVALGPFVAWQVALHALFGRWPLHESAGAAPLYHVPFQALYLGRAIPDFGLMVMTIAVPVAASFVVALAGIRRQGLAGLLRDPLPLMVLVYAVLVSLTGVPNWQDMWAPARLALPGVVLGALVAGRLSASAGASYATLLAVTALAPAVLTMR